MVLIIFWCCLITLITSQHVHGKVIIINTAGGSDNTTCCVNGECVCTSLSTALLNMTNNTVINITSESVTLEGYIKMGSGDLNNITITGNGATIMCNNSGGVYCESCDNVVIERITWDRCGDPFSFKEIVAGMMFNITSNISLLDCTFQHSQVWAVSLLGVSENIIAQNCSFLTNYCGVFSTVGECGGLQISGTSCENVNVMINQSKFYNNSNGLLVDNGLFWCKWSVVIFQTTFSFNNEAARFSMVCKDVLYCVQLVDNNVSNNNASASGVAGIYISLYANGSYSSLLFLSSVFSNNSGCVLYYTGDVAMLISNSTFTDNIPSLTYSKYVNGATVELYPATKLTLFNVSFRNNIASANPGGGGTLFIFSSGDSGLFFINLTKVFMTENKYLGYTGGAIYIRANILGSLVTIDKCDFSYVSSPGRGAALYIDDSEENNYSTSTTITMSNNRFDNSIAVDSIVYLHGKGEYTNIWVCLSNFTNNIGSSVHSSTCALNFCENILFENNTSDNGGALYFGPKTTVGTNDGPMVCFVNNVALEHGGAIYVELEYDCLSNIWSEATVENSMNFVNNSAVISGNSIFFDVPKVCHVNTNVDDSNSLLYVPCTFKYAQLVDGKMRHFNCSMLNETGFPIVTTPHQLRLYCNDTLDMPFEHELHSMCFVRSKILGQQVKLNGGTFDFFGVPAESTLFTVRCVDCSAVTQLCEDRILVDNVTPVIITFVGLNLKYAINVTVQLTSALISQQQFSTSLVVELVPCSNHPGYVYSDGESSCTCYHHNVHCFNDNNAIKQGYWFGTVNVRGISTPTTSLCPNHYCNFNHRKKSVEDGYFELPETINAQCNHHRSGIACGDCNPGYTLSYDSTECVSKDNCNAGMMVVVIALTCLYWIIVVVSVFSLMNIFFKYMIPLGYVYGIIYYYSMVGILLDNNSYISDGAFICVSILSSFAELAPQFLGQLCLAKGLDGIDQLFVHYVHAIAVSLLILFIVKAARCSIRITVFVNHGILRVICLLILLSYTSFSSTSLQLLRPLRFTDVSEVYTYASPSIKYFRDRHAIYGAVAAFCELFIVIGLPLFLLLERFISRKIVVKVMPLLNEFRGCYKDKHRWFAAYYLICRQVIVVIVYAVNSNYDNMLFYLQTACIVIAMIHMWAQPYQDESLNALDGIILLVMVLVININTFPFLRSVTTEVSLVLVILPLFLFFIIVIKKVIKFCITNGNFHHHYGLIDNNDLNHEDQFEVFDD